LDECKPLEQVSGGAGTAAADGADDGTSNLYDTSTWQVVSTLAGHVGAVYALCWLEGAAGGGGGGAGALLTGRGLHSFTLELNLSNSRKHS
jgi:WD40 repeat protein